MHCRSGQLSHAHQVLSQVQIPTQPVCVFFVLRPIVMKTVIMTKKYEVAPTVCSDKHEKAGKKRWAE
jgi:hypothetical protein